MGFDREDTPYLYGSRCSIGSLSFVNRKPVQGEKILAQPRYRTAAVSASFNYGGEDDNSIDLVFEKPQRAITPGQVCAFYSEDVLLGGGIFESVDYTK